MLGLIKELFELATARQQGFVEKLYDYMKRSLKTRGTGLESEIIYFTLKDERRTMLDFFLTRRIVSRTGFLLTVIL